jgi:hypothetical protein
MKYLLSLLSFIVATTVSASAENNWWEFEVKRVVAVHNGIVLDSMNHDFSIDGQLILGRDTFEIASKVCRFENCLIQSETYIMENHNEATQTIELHNLGGAHHVQILQHYPQLIFSYSVEPEWSLIYVMNPVADTDEKPNLFYGIHGDTIQDVLRLLKEREGENLEWSQY